ncbi:MAG: bifunctional 4-hydroxy-3-methylbut-2-enyl diphosphate reductase/30S ribosomal protein S1, partial [Clostridiales bacterium]|nr:bifunctional 4-hydroxy-3-methylbut-2-enyl diphosphate reductase/30S ribosomal protein S1 [Clostridiales bacterium]
MNIHLAEYSGFCYGVKRAIDMVCSFSDKYGNISTLGPIIHNSAVVEKLLSMGVTSIDSVDDFNGDLLVIRSHGVSPEVYEACRNKGIEIADATCPNVKKIQKKVAVCKQDNIPIIIVGQPSHPEIVGIMGWAGSGSIVLETVDDALKIPEIERACIVSQTTMPVDKWEDIVEIVKQ